MNLWKLKMRRIKNYFKYRTIFSKYWRESHIPLYQWYRARDKFKKPNCHFSFGKPSWFFGWYADSRYMNPIIDIYSSSLGWKDKYNSPRHEWDPFFAITFFRRYRLMWMWNYVSDPSDSGEYTRNVATWEAILDYIYYNKSIEWVRNNHIWLNQDNSEITIDKNLK